MINLLVLYYMFNHYYGSFSRIFGYKGRAKIIECVFGLFIIILKPKKTIPCFKN